ncbi:MAG: PSD1 and planctomycete cytochrome C domain-containing protein [Bryobacter sp.]|nr:PSD1 and planctomycete cytochrome C domain-containing protein [Bryobacter sp.]
MRSAWLMFAISPLLLGQSVSFNRDIRPIMADTCFRCHGPDAGTRMANLRLDSREAATKPNRRGQIPIVPGDPDKSLIIERIFHTSEARVMPPPYAHKELSTAQKETIRRWVAEGAKYEGHWAYEPIRKPSGASIDELVSKRLAREGLEISASADKRTLVRRVSLDLTGLPPSPEDVRAFLDDKSPQAYEKLVDRLLRSPAYAEKMAIHWLDAVRYADSAGFHGDNIFPAWPYRDYVLNSFRDNKPFDQFSREQLAGDLLPNATEEQKIASAFNRLNRVSAEGGLQPKEYLAKYGADRVRTVSTVWMGSTLGCAECHDHKFDPFLAKDFYAMKAFFADIKETGLVPDRGPKAWGSKLLLATPEQRQQLAALENKLAEAKARIEKAAPEPAPALVESIQKAYAAGAYAWQIQRPLSAKSANGATLTIYNEEEVDMMPYYGGVIRGFRAKGNGLVVASGPVPDRDTYTVTFRPAAGTWKSLGLEIVQDETLPANAVARGGDRLMLSEVELMAGQKPLRFTMATSNIADQSYQQPPAAVIDGDPKTNWGPITYGENKNLFLALRLREPLVTDGKTTLRVTLRHDGDIRKGTLGRFRLALNAVEYAWPEGTDVSTDKKRPGGLPEDVLRLAKLPSADWKPEDRKAFTRFLAWSDPKLTPLHSELAQAEQAYFGLDASIPRSLYTEATTPTETRILPRGNFLDDSGAVVEPAIPEVFGKLPTQGRATRLDLANWIVSPQNPLTPRVFVNRIWRQFFGTGLSRALDDLGSQGEVPTNPELMDWLAAEFASDWDMRRLVRNIVLSRTYQQSSQASPEALAKDPDNRLLSRQTRLRVDAEIVHDIALAASGLLAPRFGGAPVKPYQPDGYLTTLNFPKRDYSHSQGPDLYARALYTQWQRTFLHPSLMTFDAPSREECTVNRTTSNTPLQALVLLNDPIYVEAARVFAQNMLAAPVRTLRERIDWAFERALARPATEAEQSILTELYQSNLKRFTQEPLAAQQLLTVGEAPLPAKVRPAELAAATTVTRAILNLHETITRN